MLKSLLGSYKMDLTHVGMVYEEQAEFSVEIYFDRYDYIVFVYKDGKDYKSFRANDIEDVRNKLNELFSVFRIIETKNLLD
jgi:hypothetical protein